MIPDVEDHSRPLFGTRTQSGSFISAISKHPTPAPSSPGADHDNFDSMLGQGDDVFGPDQSLNEPLVNRRNAFLTPDATPSRAGKLAQLMQQVDRYKRSAKEAQRASAESQETLQGKVSHPFNFHFFKLFLT